MQIAIVIALALVVVASVMNHKDGKSNLVINPLPTTSETVDLKLVQPTVIITASVHPSEIPTNFPRPTTPPSNQPQVYLYPGLKHTTGNKYESIDKPEVITTWYENQIRTQGFLITTFIKTNSNDNILNKLVGSKSGYQYKVEISRSPSESVTTVILSLDK